MDGITVRVPTYRLVLQGQLVMHPAANSPHLSLSESNTPEHGTLV
jgi:hypothetical protein